MIELSVITPTRNRADYLKDALSSILEQTLDKSLYEIIVIDNGSTDRTRQVVEELNRARENRVRYLYAPAPGLHVGRHLGARESRSNILVYTDDDIIASPGWLEAIRTAFNDPGIALVGGKILPKWEGEVPDWVALFGVTNGFGWTNGYLTLLDFGDERKAIPAEYVYGASFPIRKAIMYECGGFHPDSLPQELIRFRGDGETALSLALAAKGYRTVYEPKAVVHHRIPPERLTVDYFCRRAFNQGISDSYAEIRRQGGLKAVSGTLRRSRLILGKLREWSGAKQTHPVLAQVEKSYEEGRRYHRKQITSDPDLLAFVLKADYFEPGLNGKGVELGGG